MVQRIRLKKQLRRLEATKEAKLIFSKMSPTCPTLWQELYVRPLKWGWLCPPRDICNVWRRFGLCDWGVVLLALSRGQGSAGQCTMPVVLRHRDPVKLPRHCHHLWRWEINGHFGTAPKLSPDSIFQTGILRFSLGCQAKMRKSSVGSK